MLEIQNSVAVITGGASGIGLSLARYWVEQGGRVVVADADRSALDAACRELGNRAAGFPCDITKEKDNADLAGFAMERFGGIHMVVPCAGIIRDGLMVSVDRETGKVNGKMGLEQFSKVVDVNLIGTFLTVRECTEQMINHGCHGLICLISSTGSLGTAGQINYSSTKAAVSVMPKVITAELFRRGLAHQIRCAAIAPGYVETPILAGMNQKALDKILTKVPISRLIEPSEIASLAGELFRNQALTGEVYFIHGGLRLGSDG